MRFGAYHLQICKSTSKPKVSTASRAARALHRQMEPAIHIGNILTRLFQYGVRTYLDRREPSCPEYLYSLSLCSLSFGMKKPILAGTTTPRGQLLRAGCRVDGSADSSYQTDPPAAVAVVGAAAAVVVVSRAERKKKKKKKAPSAAARSPSRRRYVHHLLVEVGDVVLGHSISEYVNPFYSPMSIFPPALHAVRPAIIRRARV